MTAANVLAYAAQVTIVVIVCAGLPRLLRLRSPAVQYAFWRMVLLVCLLLPILQPWQPAAMAFVPAPSMPEEVDRNIRSLVQKAKRVVRMAGLRPQ